jgi:plasmid stability protein
LTGVKRKNSGLTGIDSNASNASIAVMATLTIRNLPDEVYDRLRVRAAENKRSMEAEARAVLMNAEKAAHPHQKTITHEEAMRNLKSMMAAIKPKEGFESLTDEFLAERRAMWGEDD